MHGYQGLLELFEGWDKQGEVIDFAEIVQAMKRIKLERADLAGALIFANRTYRRIAIRRRPHYEAMVLCWKSGQRSPIHNHSGSSCVVRVIEGLPTETRFVPAPVADSFRNGLAASQPAQSRDAWTGE
jgi:cysteine dioxygenase